MVEVCLVAGLRMEGVGALRDFAVAESVLHLEGGRVAPARALMVDVDGRVFVAELDGVPREERSVGMVKQALRSFRSVGVPTGFVLVLPAGSVRAGELGFCVVTHDGLGAEGEGFVLRGGRVEVVPAPESVMSSGLLDDLQEAGALA